MIDLSRSTAPEIGFVTTVARRLDPILASLSIEYLVVGAAARNIVAIGLFDRPPERATRDVDLAIVVPSWRQVDTLSARLERVGRSQHKFIVDGVEVDIVPCGGIESDGRSIDWADDVRMNVLGFREAFDTALDVCLAEDISIRVPSLAVQVLLKLVAWTDRQWTTTKDAVDIATMLDLFTRPPLLDELYDKHSDLMTTARAFVASGADPSRTPSPTRYASVARDLLEDAPQLDRQRCSELARVHSC